jgi:hypothetical protein
VEITYTRPTMRRLGLSLLALPACLALAGCYYDPDYGYVRNGTGADAYVGTETTTVVSGDVGYYGGPAYGPGYGYYGYGPGCCYGGTTVIYRDGYGRRYYGDRYGHGRPPPGGWNHGPPPRGGDWHGRPPGGGDGHGRPPGGGDGHGRPPGGGDWHGRPPPPGGWGSRGGDHGPPQGRPNPPPGGWHGNRPSSPPSGGSGRPPPGSRGEGRNHNHND